MHPLQPPNAKQLLCDFGRQVYKNKWRHELCETGIVLPVIFIPFLYIASSWFSLTLFLHICRRSMLYPLLQTGYHY